MFRVFDRHGFALFASSSEQHEVEIFGHGGEFLSQLVYMVRVGKYLYMLDLKDFATDGVQRITSVNFF